MTLPLLGVLKMTEDDRLLLYSSNRFSTTHISISLPLPTNYSHVICLTLHRRFIIIVRRKQRNARRLVRNIIANCKFTSSFIDLCFLDCIQLRSFPTSCFSFITHYLCLHYSSYITLSSPVTLSALAMTDYKLNKCVRNLKTAYADFIKDFFVS
jgi:hypothetical protein